MLATGSVKRSTGGAAWEGLLCFQSICFWSSCTRNVFIVRLQLMTVFARHRFVYANTKFEKCIQSVHVIFFFGWGGVCRHIGLI